MIENQARRDATATFLEAEGAEGCSDPFQTPEASSNSITFALVSRYWAGIHSMWAQDLTNTVNSYS
jgi:hypothetical protein